MKWLVARLRRKMVSAAAMCSFAIAGSALGCGLDWALPTNHFDGVDSQGYVAYWEKIGEVDCGDGLVLPLHINFNSQRDAGAPSPYLGQGWLLPLLESKFVQESEDRFVMIQPDGLSNLFLRRGGLEGTLLDGSAGWKGEIQGNNIITAWASCGWKLVFANGRIASMNTPKGRKLDWVYEGGMVRELREGGATRMKVEYGADGICQALSLPDGRRILLAQDRHPRVQVVGGQNVVAGVDRSLSKLTLADGKTQTFTFGTDEKTLPTLRVEENATNERSDGAIDSLQSRLLSWNPQTLLIVKDNAWSYQITPARKAYEDAAIGRTDTQGRKEYWFWDGPNGRETVLDAAGVETVTTRFMSGKAAGRIKSVASYKGDQLLNLKKYYFDEKGFLIREIDGDLRLEYTDRKLTKVFKKTEMIWCIDYNANGKTAKIEEGGYEIYHR